MLQDRSHVDECVRFPPRIARTIITRTVSIARKNVGLRGRTSFAALGFLCHSRRVTRRSIAILLARQFRRDGKTCGRLRLIRVALCDHDELKSDINDLSREYYDASRSLVGSPATIPDP